MSHWAATEPKTGRSLLDKDILHDRRRNKRRDLVEGKPYPDLVKSGLGGGGGLPGVEYNRADMKSAYAGCIIRPADY